MDTQKNVTGQEARNHHFVPQFYLRGFSTTKKAKRQVWVADRTSGRSFIASVRNVAAKRDFNRVNLEDHPPDVLEQALALFEEEANSALHRIVKSRSFADEQDRIPIFNLIALLATRSPRLRRIMGKFEERLMRGVLNTSLATEERWKSIQARMKADGYEPKHNLTYEQMRDFARSKNYTVRFSNTSQIALELSTLDSVLETVFERRWMLMIADQGASDFITCDHPVCLSNNKPSPRFFGPGHGMKQTSLFFPLTRRMALLGQFEGADVDIQVNLINVARMNWHTMLFADRQVYAADNNFHYMQQGRFLKRGEDLIKEPVFIRTSSDDEDSEEQD